MPTVSEALQTFLQARKTPANADLVDKWSSAMETQVNVAAGDGEPVANKRSTYSNGVDTWHSIRIPKDANSEPSWKDYKLSFSIGEHAEGIGCTGWDWQARLSRWVAFDFDSLMGHAKGVGLTERRVAAGQRGRHAASVCGSAKVHRRRRHAPLRLLRRRRHPVREPHGPRRLGPLHPRHDVERVQLRLRLPDRLLRRRDVDLAPEDDCRRIWGSPSSSRRPRCCPQADLPANWRDHIEVVTRKRAKVRINEVADDKLDAFEALATSRKIIPLDDSHKAQIEALQRSGYTTLWVADHHLLQTHTCRLEGISGQPGGQGTRPDRRLRDQSRKAGTPPNPTAFSFPCPMAAGGSSASPPASPRPTPGTRTAKDGPPATSTTSPTWPPPPSCAAASRTPTKPASPSRRLTMPSKSPRYWDRKTSPSTPCSPTAKPC